MEQPMNKVEQIYGNLSKIDDQGFFQISRYIDSISCRQERRCTGYPRGRLR